MRRLTSLLATGALVAMFTVNASTGIGAADGTGQLTFVDAFFDDTEGVGLDGAHSVRVSPDGAHVYATGHLEDSVSVFSRDGTTGLLTHIDTVRNGLGGVDGINRPIFLDISPDGRHVYVPGEDDNAVAVFERDPATGLLTFVERKVNGIDFVTGLGGAHEVAVSADGAFVFVASRFDHAVVVFLRDTVTGRLDAAQPVFDGQPAPMGGVPHGLGGADSVAGSPDSRYLYVAGGADNAITVFHIDDPTGMPTLRQEIFEGVDGVSGLVGAKALLVTTDGAYVYSGGHHGIAAFARDTVTGELTFLQSYLKAQIPSLDFVQKMALTADGRHMYASGTTANAVTIFDRDPSTGLLTFSDVEVDGQAGVLGLGGALALELSPDDLHLYVASLYDDAVAVFETSPDTTPPVIVADVAGTMGNDGWYTGDVTIGWAVTDDESAISSTNGCDPATVMTDTAGIALTCSATSSGGTASAEVTIRRDATPPAATATAAPPPNAAGWNNTAVTVSFTATDALSGVASCDPEVVLTSDGADQSASGTCTDLAGNLSAATTATGIDIDQTPPTAAATATPPPNAAGWNSSDVAVSFVGTDTGSGIDSCHPDVVLGNDGVNQSASGACSDVAGNTSATATASGINVDQTPPAATATATPPPNAAGWNLTPVTVSFTGTDALSGLASCDADVVLSSDGTDQSASGYCTDTAGNVSAVAAATGIDIDQHAPALVIDEVVASPYGWLGEETFVSFPARLGSESTRVLITAVDLVGVSSATVNGRHAAAGGNDWWALGGVDLSEGANTLTAVATDVAGHSTQRSVDVVVSTDLDGDGIRNDVDKQPRIPSYDFSDQFPTGLGYGSFRLEMTPDETKVYVADNSSGALSVIDTATSTVVATIPVGGRPLDVAISPDGTRAYVTNNEAAVVHVIDTATNVELPPAIPVGDAPYGIAVSPDGEKVYVANRASSSVSVIDTGTRSVATVGVPTGPYDVAVSSDGERLAVVGEDVLRGSAVLLLALPSLGLIHRDSLYHPSTSLAVQPGTDLIYVTELTGDRVGIYSPGLTGRSFVSVGAEQSWVSFSPDGAKAYVAHHASGTVTVIDAQSETVSGSIAVGGQPNGVAVGASRAYVALFGSSVAVVDAPTGLVIDTISASSAGTSFGTVVDSGDDVLWIYDLPHPEGVKIDTTAFGPDPAIVHGCGHPYDYTPRGNAEFRITCGSITLSVDAGTVEVGFETPDGVQGTATVTEGNTLKLHPPETPTDPPLYLSVPDTNPDPVVVVINGVEVPMEPGTTNLPPIIDTLTAPAEPAPIGSVVTTAATFTDLEAGDTHTAVWDWDDDSTSLGAVDGGAVTGDHTYTTPGVYTVTLTVTDHSGGSDIAVSEFVVIFDPAGKDFHGNGKYDLGTEELRFGFDLKPQNGAPFLKGHFRFDLNPHDEDGPTREFEEADLSGLFFFTDWALATGTGVWESGGAEIEAEFVVSGLDGHATGTDDAIRIKVWRAGQPSMVLFDTTPGDADFALPSLVPDKSNIKIKSA